MLITKKKKNENIKGYDMKGTTPQSCKDVVIHIVVVTRVFLFCFCIFVSYIFFFWHSFSFSRKKNT